MYDSKTHPFMTSKWLCHCRRSLLTTNNEQLFHGRVHIVCVIKSVLPDTKRLFVVYYSLVIIWGNQHVIPGITLYYGNAAILSHDHTAQLILIG